MPGTWADYNRDHDRNPEGENGVDVDPEEEDDPTRPRRMDFHDRADEEYLAWKEGDL